MIAIFGDFGDNVLPFILEILTKISLSKREQGEVQNAMAKTAQVDKLKEERERIRQRHITLTQQNAPEMPQSYNGIQEKQMEVCEICGSFLIVGDAQVKIPLHLVVYQSMGYNECSDAPIRYLVKSGWRVRTLAITWDILGQSRRSSYGETTYGICKNAS